jgi:hypothetical protein
MANKVPILSIEKLEVLHTGTLMARRKALLKCEESLELSDQSICNTEPGIIEFKNTETWQQAYIELKRILSNRENIPNKKVRKTMRQTKL